MLCCCEKNVEKKTLTKPLLAESKSSTGEPKITVERKLTGYEKSLPKPIAPKPEPIAPKPEPIAPKPEPIAPKPEPIAPKPEPKPEVTLAPVPPKPVEPKPEVKLEPIPPKPIVPKSEPKPEITLEPIPSKPIVQPSSDPTPLDIRNPETSKNEKKNNSKSNKRI